MNIYSKKLILYLGSAILAISFLFLFLVLPKFEVKIKDELVNNISYAYKGFIKNINKDFIQQHKISSLNDLKKIKNRLALAHHLSLMKNDNIEYIFAVYKEDNIYKILIDVSDTDKSNFDEIFFPTEKEEKALDRIYKTKREAIIFHEAGETKKIGITLLEPLIINNKVQAVVFVDFTVQTLLTINKLINMLKLFLIFVISFISALIIFTIYTTLKVFYFKKKAYIDELTGVYNRNYLEEVLPEINLQKYVVALFDIDYFKKINDTYGHKAGDEILKKFAKILKNSFREDEDVIVRYGGEEFLVLIKKDRRNSLSVLNAVKRAVDRIRKAMFPYGKEVLRLTTSVGVLLDTEKEKSLSEAIKKADVALYKAKLAGRNRIEIYEEENVYLSITKINNLIEKGNILCHYQPVVDLNNSRKVLYFEALVRLKDDDGTIIYPNSFLELIKNTYLYAKLSKKVLEYNVDILRKYKNIKVSVNLSPSDLINETLIKDAISLEEHIVKRLKFEILETEEIKNYDKVLDNLKRLKEKGFQISIDDFGSGYSNFKYLLNLDIDFIKIDANLIKNINESKKSQELVKAIVLFAKNNSISTIAEFIENEKILETVKKLGVEYGQGYYFSKPKTIEEILEEKKWDI